MIYLTLFLEFFKVGLFSVGGGLSTIPFLYELADKYNWFDQKMLNGYDCCITINSWCYWC